MTDQSEFVDVYSLTTRAKQRVPRIWVDDPILGRDLALTPSQRELDGDLGPRPRQDTEAKDIQAYAEAAGIDLAGTKDKTAKLVAIEAAFASTDVQVGMVDVDPAPPTIDPLAPGAVAHTDAPATPPADLAADSTTSTDDTGSSEETPAAGDEE